MQTFRSKWDYYGFLAMIISIGSVSFFATDIYLPALPQMTSYFECAPSEMQMSFTSFFLGLALCQLCAGVLSDRFGRRRVLIMGIALFTLSSYLCVHANTLSQFIGVRMIQAMGGGVCSVVFRALVVDRFPRQQAAKIFSVVFPLIGLSAAIAPMVGAQLTRLWDWRATFYFMSGFGLLNLIFAIFFLSFHKTTLREQKALDGRPLAKKNRWLGLLNNVEFLGYTFVICSCFCVFRSYTVESPFVFDKQGYLTEEIGSFYVGLSVSYLLGSLAARKLMSTLSMKKVLRIGMGVFVVGGLVMMIATPLFSENAYAVILPMCIITLGNGLLFPIGSAGAITSVPGDLSGTATGFLGAMQFVVAAICIAWVGEICGGRAIHMSYFIGALVLLGFLGYFLLLHRRQIGIEEESTHA